MSIGRVPGATGIQPSIVTAKGDLIVATASGSVTNQAVGSNNQVLTADSAQADGVKWANGSAATLTTTGDLLYASAANTPARLGIGSTNQVLTVSGGVPTWATPAGGGKVLQVVQGTTTTRMETTSTTYVDTNLTASITPSATSSKVLVLVFQNIHLNRINTDVACQYKLVRGTTTMSEMYLSMYNSTGGNAEIRQMGTFSYLDSPATTSSTTYKTQVRSANASTTSDLQENSSLAAIVLLEIGA